MRDENERRRENAKAGEGVDLREPITLHECGYTFASLMIAAGVDPKALGEYIGHASITLTLDR